MTEIEQNEAGDGTGLVGRIPAGWADGGCYRGEAPLPRRREHNRSRAHGQTEG